MNDDRGFIDTNVFVYAKLENRQDAEKYHMAVRFLEEIEPEVHISIQVVNEFSNVLLRNGIEDDIIRQAVKEITDTCIVYRL